MDFELFKSPSDSSKFHRKFLWRDQDGEIFTDITEIHTLELPKVPSGGGEETDWLELFKTEDEADLERLAKKSPLMEQAVSRLRIVSGDEDVRKLISARDYWARMDNDRATYERKEGREEGREEERTLIKAVFTMLKKNLSDHEIIEQLQLTAEELKQYKKDYEEVF